MGLDTWVLWGACSDFICRELENKFALWSAVPGQALPEAASVPEARKGVWFLVFLSLPCLAEISSFGVSMGVSPSEDLGPSWGPGAVGRQWLCPCYCRGTSFHPTGVMDRGFCLSLAAQLSYKMSARDRAAQGLPAPAQMEEAARVAGLVVTGGPLGSRSGLWGGVGSRDTGQGEAVWSHCHPAILQCEPSSSPVPLPPGVQQLLCHTWAWQRGCWRWWIRA